MDYEKKYKETLEKARQLCAYPTSKPFISDLQDLFPELKESEDERIRDWLIAYLENRVLNTGIIQEKENCKEAIAWLEKQGEKKKFIKKELGYIKGYRELAIKRLNEIEKQGEQKPANKIEPKFKKGDVIRRKDGDGLEWTVEDLHKDGNYTIFNSDRDDFVYLDDNWELVEQKSAWSEEVQEEQVSEEFINTLGTMLNDGLPDRYLVSEERIKKSAELLFSIARKQLKNEKQEWSVEDSNGLQNTIALIEGVKNINSKDEYCMESCEYCLNWLKSLRPQNKWNPSDEQINTLWDAIVYVEGCNSNFKGSGSVLENLYNDLKKLKG